jgi:O-antigen ligase
MATQLLGVAAAPGAALAAAAPARAAGIAGLRLVRVLQLAIVLLIVANLAIIPVFSMGAGSGKDAPIFFNDFLIGALFVAGALAALRARRLVLDPPALAALGFAAVAALSTALAIPRFGLTGFEFLVSIAYLLRWLVYFAVYLVVINFVRYAEAERVWRTFEAMVLVFTGFGILQSLFLPGFAQMVYPDTVIGVDWDDQGRRLVSTFLDPNFAGALILMPLLVLLARLSFGVPVERWKLLLLFAGLVLTVSRSSFVALVVAGGFLLLVRGLQKRLLKFGGLLLLLLLPALPLIVTFAAGFNKFMVDPSAMSRVLAWLLALEILADNPLLGIGFNTFGYVRELYGTAALGRAGFTLDGGLLFIAMTTGLVGVLLYSAMLLLVLRRCRRLWRDEVATPEARGIGLGVAAVTVALVVHSVFLNSLLFPFLMEPLWLLWGLTYVLRQPAEAEALAATSRVARPVLIGLGPSGVVGSR